MKCYKNLRQSVTQYHGVTIVETVTPLYYKPNPSRNDYYHNGYETDEFEYKFKKIPRF